MSAPSWRTAAPPAGTRLETLRRDDTLGHYAGTGPTTGSDESGSVRVTVGPDRRVSSVEVTSLTEPARSAPALADMLQRAYTAAVSAQIDAGLAQVGRPYTPQARKPVAAATPGGPRPVVADFGRAPRHEVEAFRARHRAGAPTSRRGATGVSRNDCVHVTLHPTDQFGDLEVDQGWLAAASAAHVARAVVEAFDAAYQERDAT